MKSDVVSACQKLLRRREEAAAALAAIDKEIAEVRELLGGGGAPDAPAVRTGPKARRLGKVAVRPNPRHKMPISPGSNPGHKDLAERAATAAAQASKDNSAEDRIVLKLASGPRATSELVAALKLTEYQVRTACQAMEKAGVLARLGTGPRNSRWAIASKEAKTATPRTNGSGRKDPDYDVAWSGRESLTGA